MTTLVFGSKKYKRQTLNNLKRGLKTLMTRGWCQGTYSQREPDGTKSYCAVGSFRDTVKNKWNIDLGMTCDALRVGINQVMPGAKMTYGDPLSNCTEWNDRKGRTAAQVKRAFRAAIKATERA